MAFPSHGLTHRSTVTGTRGMVTSAHPLASLAGVRILFAGGMHLMLQLRLHLH